jgi:hypothetical protein
VTTDQSARERLSIRVLRSAGSADGCTDGELAGLSAEVDPATDLPSVSEQKTWNTKVVGPKPPILVRTSIREYRGGELVQLIGG